MNRNVESHFSQLPSIDIERSIFDRSSTVKTTFNAGDLIPFYLDEVLPGDTFRVTTSKVIRAQTMLTPIMDNMYLDTYFFFVPNRLVWTHWEEFCGANKTSAWTPTTSYVIPSINAPSGGFNSGTIADYFGLPLKTSWTSGSSVKKKISALPFRAYAKICNDWFLAETVSDPLNIPTGDATQTGSNGSSYINDVANGGLPFKVAKYHDYFTSCLPAPQRIDTPVGFDFAQTLTVADKAPVGSLNVAHDFGDFPTSYAQYNSSLNNVGTRFGVPLDNTSHIYGSYSDGAWNPDSETNVITGAGSDNWLYPVNLWADLDGAISLSGDGSFTINELRLAFQLQKWYEKMARAGGGRYIEILKAHFGVTSPDARLQRSEYLGGNRIPLNIHEVTNSAQSTTDFLGDLGAKCATSDIHEDFEKSFTEHGYVIGVMCVRYDHSYPQGIERMWLRREFTDFYWPVFANIGEQPVYNAEIYGTAALLNSGSVFGYQEAWADYRFKPSRVTGEFRPGIANTLASWHLADYYTSLPTLSDSWIREDKTNVDRCLAVTSSVSNQFFCDIYIENIATRPMPVYSIPGLIDHH